MISLKWYFFLSTIPKDDFVSINRKRDLNYIFERLHRFLIQEILLIQCFPHMIMMVIVHVLFLNFSSLEYFVNQYKSAWFFFSKSFNSKRKSSLLKEF